MQTRESKNKERRRWLSLVKWRPPKETDGGEKEEGMETNPGQDRERVRMER